MNVRVSLYRTHSHTSVTAGPPNRHLQRQPLQLNLTFSHSQLHLTLPPEDAHLIPHFERQPIDRRLVPLDVLCCRLITYLQTYLPTKLPSLAKSESFKPSCETALFSPPTHLLPAMADLNSWEGEFSKPLQTIRPGEGPDCLLTHGFPSPQTTKMPKMTAISRRKPNAT